jgi:hypothetical protein
MTANRRDEQGLTATLTINGKSVKWFDEVSEIRYEEAVKPSRRRRTDFSGSFTMTGTMPRVSPGLARNRRARERWVRYVRQFLAGWRRKLACVEYAGGRQARRANAWL